ncbi:MAG: hypothetical protein H6739_24400 [Alphaproteobacteria bacterium]|nr:hypothetical protein [Alphaproteobacteria bacterium]
MTLLTTLALACATSSPPAAGGDPVNLDTPAWKLATRHPDRPAIVAHRGASLVAPENTLAAYRKAIELGATAAETDLRLTRDRHVVILHDDTLDRTTTGAGALEAHTWAALEGVDAGSWFGEAFAGEPIPDLDGLLDTAGDALVLCLEIKDGVAIEQEIRAALDAKGRRAQAVIFSFDADKVALSRLAMPDVPAVYLLRPRETGALDEAGAPVKGLVPVMLEEARAIDASAIGMSQHYVDAGLIRAAHDAGYPVFVWTVDEPEALPPLLEAGVDVLITDAPDTISAALDALLTTP